jgi:TP901 family phage tail tape measure protein
MTAAGLAGQTFGQKFKAAFGKFAQYVSVSTIVLSAIRSVKQMVSDVKELDSAMTQLQIVSGKSTSEIRKFGDEAIQVAKKIGVSVTDILKASETYARLGYSLKDAMNLSEYTNIFANIASIDASSATDAITSVMKAYQLDAGDAEHITDILTKVGQEYAVSASELGIALQNGGASLQAANNSLEKSVALIAAGNAAVQDASKVGNALKTTSMRIRGATTAELEDAGADVDGMAESVSKLRDELLALSGVDIQIDENTFKDTYTIILELSKVWDKMSDISQANVLELLAGKRNATVIQSIISNIDDLEGAYASASNAMGTTAEANDIYVNSIEGKQKQLKTSFTEFSDSVVNSDLIKGTFDAGSGILGFLTKLNEAIGVLPTTFGIAGIGMLLKNLGLTRNDGLYTGLSVYKCAA